MTIFNVFSEQEEGCDRLESCCSTYPIAESYRHFLAENEYHLWYSYRETITFDLTLSNYYIMEWRLI